MMIWWEYQGTGCRRIILAKDIQHYRIRIKEDTIRGRRNNFGERICVWSKVIRSSVPSLKLKVV